MGRFSSKNSELVRPQMIIPKETQYKWPIGGDFGRGQIVFFSKRPMGKIASMFNL